jgi:hypothetical protein
VVEARHAVPFANSILTADFCGFRIWGGREEGDGGGDRLNAAVERGGIEALDWRVQGREVCGELVGLGYAVAGEGGI